MVERTRLLDDGRVEIEDRPPHPGQNILPQAAEMRRGDKVLPAAAVLRPQEFGVLATVGRTTVSVHPQPRVAILSTGDEMVEPARTAAGPGQIRNSNGSDARRPGQSGRRRAALSRHRAAMIPPVCGR